MNYARFITRISKNRNPCLIRELIGSATAGPPSSDLVFLAGGMPNPNLFPFEEASIHLRDGTQFNMRNELMTSSLQYGPTQGYEPLLKQLKSLVKNLHNPPLWEDTDLTVVAGSQDGLCKAIEMLIGPNDYFIIQEPCYTGTLAILNPYNPKYISVECDDEGMIPESLRSSLSAWNPQEIRKKDKGIPKVMYINPNACNPSGASIPEQRRREIYKLACDYDLIILEDDPYYFIQFEDRKNFCPSFLSLDTEGRVIRFDSFSKVLSAGIRLGFVTGPKPLVRNIMLHMQVSVLQASSLSQVMVSELLNQWTEEGFLQHTDKVKAFYEDRKNIMVKAAEKYLTDLCEWSVPTGGMFLWIKVRGVVDTWDMIMERGLTKNIVLVPGKAFYTDSNAPSQYLRAAFSLVTPEQIELGMKYLAELIREEIKRNEG